MRKRLFCALLALVWTAAALVVGYVRGRSEATPATPPALVIERPTGEVVTGAGGSGEPQPRYERVTLRHCKVVGEPTACPTDPGPWRITVGGVTHVYTPAH